MSERILVVEDELKMRRVLQMALEEEGYSVEVAKDGKEAINKISEETFHLLIADIKMPRLDGMELLEIVKKETNSPPVIMMTAYGTVQTAVQAMKNGAYDYILKPFDVEEMKLIVSRAISMNRFQKEKELQVEQLTKRYGLDRIIGETPEIKEILETIKKVADVKSTVLIYGESGTGKELVAHAIHLSSKRRECPFIVVNCASVSETLLQSELFGHVKGAFTGAHVDKPGRFELAEGGSLFLDEVGAMSPALQAGLLRFIEAKQFERVGGTKTIQADVRIIAATNLDLREEIQKGNFREDLYYRLNVVPITLPPLRKRKADIAILAEHFLNMYRFELGKDIKKFSTEALNVLSNYDWPGNVRELENVVERAVVLAKEKTLGKEDIPLDLGWKKIDNTYENRKEHSDWSSSYKEAKNELLESFERDFFKKALQETGGNMSKAADLMRMDRKNFHEKLRKLNIDVGKTWQKYHKTGEAD